MTEPTHDPEVREEEVVHLEEDDRVRGKQWVEHLKQQHGLEADKTPKRKYR